MQGQTDTNAETNIQNALNLSETNERHRERLAREEQSRNARDEDLQVQIDRTAEAGIDNALNIHQEAEQRRKSDERIEALNEESGHQQEIDDYHQRQIDNLFPVTQNPIFSPGRVNSQIQPSVITQHVGFLFRFCVLYLQLRQHCIHLTFRFYRRKIFKAYFFYGSLYGVVLALAGFYWCSTE